MTKQNDYVDLRSDTVTKPTPAMREAMAAAEVGDDVFGEDPSVNLLQQRVADLLEKEAALFVPSGTMANLVAILSQTSPGETVILSEDSHPYNYEGGNMALVGGLMTRPIKGEFGLLTAEAIAPYINRTPDHHFSLTTLISIENTTNRGGGAIYELGTIADIHRLAQEFGMKVHLDGARLFNAVVESDATPAEHVRHVDTVSFCFSKGLGAPVGSIVAGSMKTIEKAHRFRKILGGGMRQAGVLAAAAQYALDNHVKRLRDDHGRAQAFRDALEGLHGVSFPLPTPTNIVILDVPDALSFVSEAASRGVMMLPFGPTRVRAVFHLNVDDNGLDQAIEASKQALANV